jgi:hypothetical protein
MTEDDILSEAQKKRLAAMRGLERMFGIPEGYSSTAVTQIVDAIIDAAVLEVTAARAKELHKLTIDDTSDRA